MSFERAGSGDGQSRALACVEDFLKDRWGVLWAVVDSADTVLDIVQGAVLANMSIEYCKKRYCPCKYDGTMVSWFCCHDRAQRCART